MISPASRNWKGEEDTELHIIGKVVLCWIFFYGRKDEYICMLDQCSLYLRAILVMGKEVSCIILYLSLRIITKYRLCMSISVHVITLLSSIQRNSFNCSSMNPITEYLLSCIINYDNKLNICIPACSRIAVDVNIIIMTLPML